MYVCYVYQDEIINYFLCIVIRNFNGCEVRIENILSRGSLCDTEQLPEKGARTRQGLYPNKAIKFTFNTRNESIDAFSKTRTTTFHGLTRLQCT